MSRKRKMSNSDEKTSTSNLLIWFHLYDYDTGLPYKGTRATSVLRSSLAVPIIDQFCDAVKVKYDQPGYLKDIPSGTLKVFKNKDSFDKRDSKEEKVNLQFSYNQEESLEEDSMVDGLGKSKKEALIVVVPLFVNEPLILPPCEVTFFNNLTAAQEKNGYLSFQDCIPSTKLENIYIRESYKVIKSNILALATNLGPKNIPEIGKAIVTGTPGIGKSLFLFYLLWNLLKESKRVLFVYHPFTIYFDGQGGVFLADQKKLFRKENFWTFDLWCLFDAKEKLQNDLRHFRYENCMFVISSSPRRDLVNDFKKNPEPLYSYMPIWNKEEMEKISGFFQRSSKEWPERFRILGGIPRNVLENTKKSPTQILEAACSNATLEECIKRIGPNSEISEKSNVIHCLIHINSTAPFTDYSVSYASETALNIIARSKEVEAKRKMRDLLYSCEGEPLTSTLLGYIFEGYAIEKLANGGTFKCRKLLAGRSREISKETTIDIERSEQIVAESVSSNHIKNQLYVPKRKNYAGIDAWITNVGAFQMTVSKKHEININSVDDLSILGNKLYWALPPTNYNSFTKKNPQNIEQYAILIPYPELKDL